MLQCTLANDETLGRVDLNTLPADLAAASHMSLYDLKNLNGQVLVGNENGAVLDGPVDVTVPLHPDITYSPGTIMDCRHWAAEVELESRRGFGWGESSCNTQEVRVGEIICRCESASGRLVSSGLVVQKPSACLVDNVPVSSCQECMRSGCGWCNENRQCVEGNPLGPFDSETCPSWVVGKCPVQNLCIRPPGSDECTDTASVVEFEESGELIATIRIVDPDMEIGAGGYVFSRLDQQGLHIVGPEDPDGRVLTTDSVSNITSYEYQKGRI